MLESHLVNVLITARFCQCSEILLKFPEIYCPIRRTANLNQNGTAVKLVLNKIILGSTYTAGSHSSLHFALLALMIDGTFEKPMADIFVKCTKPFWKKEFIFRY